MPVLGLADKGAASNSVQCPSTTTAVRHTSSRAWRRGWGGTGVEKDWDIGQRNDKTSCCRYNVSSLIQSDNAPMKLATYQDGSRDGQLVVVSRDLSQAHYATHIANRLQQVLDDWNYLAPQLQDVYDALNAGRARHAFPFDATQCLAPLPRAYQWADGSAYLNHVELVRKARGAEVPATFYTDPLMYQGGSDDILGACSPIVCASEDYGIDFEAEVAVITGDVPMGCAPERALDGIRLVLCSPLLGAEPLMCRIPLVPTPLLPSVPGTRVGADKAGLLRTRGGRGTPARAPSRWVRSWPPGSEARLHRTQLVIAAPPTLVSYDLPRLGGGAERSPITSRVSIRVERERGGPPSALQFVGRGRRGDAELAVVVGKVEHV